MPKKPRLPARVSDRLRHAVQHGNLTRYRIAQLSGVLESTLCKFMAGGGLHLDSVDLICEALGLELVKKPTKKPNANRS